MKTTWGGPDEGVNSWYTWASTNNEVGSGKITITQSSPTLDSIVTSMLFGGMEDDTSWARYFFKPVEGGIEMTMTMDSKYGYNLIGRYFGLMIKSKIEENYVLGLENIRKIAEDGMAAAAAGNYAIVETWQNEQPYYSYRDTASMPTIAAKFQANFQRIQQAMQKTGVNMAGPVFAIVHHFDSTGFDIEWGIPTNKAGSGDGDVRAAQLSAGKIIKADYFGPYEATQPAYNAIERYAKDHALQLDAHAREVYITDPMYEKDTKRLLTYIIRGVK